jgi:hypothetical protein
MSVSERGARTTIGSKILLAAVMVVAGTIGISGIYPQAIDAVWMQETGAHLPITSVSTFNETTASGAPAVIPLPPRRVATIDPPPETAARLAVAQISEAEAKTEAPAG